MRFPRLGPIAASVAGAFMLVAASLAPTPASAQWHGGGGFHGGGFGGGGWHGGGFGGGGWHGGGWGGGGWHGGGWNGGGWRGGGWNGGGWRGGGWGWRGGYAGWGGGWGYPGWGYSGWGYPWWGWTPGAVVVNGGYSDDGCWAWRRVWSRPGQRGRYLGRRLVNVCG